MADNLFKVLCTGAIGVSRLHDANLNFEVEVIRKFGNATGGQRRDLIAVQQTESFFYKACVQRKRIAFY